MAFYKTKKVWKLKDNKVTPENFYNTRRDFLKKLGAGSLFLPGTSFISRPAFSSLYPPAINKSYITSRPLTAESLATTYTNFYEFGSSKNIWRRASKLKTKPWSITIDGLVDNPLVIDVNDLIKKIGGIEERVYRFRCVEAWSMTVPWAGFPLNKILSLVEPKTNAKFLKFETKDQSKTYFRKTLEWCIDKNILEISIFGISGKSDDHFLGNYYTLNDFGSRIQWRAFTDFSIISPCKGMKKFESFKGQKVSLFCMKGSSTISSKNLEYPLKSYQLKPSDEAVRNIAIADQFTIESTNTIFVFQSRQ